MAIICHNNFNYHFISIVKNKWEILIPMSRRIQKLQKSILFYVEDKQCYKKSFKSILIGVIYFKHEKVKIEGDR